MGGDGLNFLQGRVEMEWKFCRETGRGRAGIDMKSAGMGVIICI